MTKKKTICYYELLCLGKKDKTKYEKLITEIENLIGKENMRETREEKWKPVYPIKQLSKGSYWLIYFVADRSQIPQLENNILRTAAATFLSRYNLINLTDRKSKAIVKKNVVE